MKRLLIGLIAAVLAFAANAEESAAVKYRQNTMEAVGGHMGDVVAIAKGEVDHKGHLPVHTASLAGLSGIVPDLFGPDAQGGDALPAIWSEPEAFQKRLAAFRTAAEDLDGVVKSGEMANFGTALNALGQACKGCHDDFKEKE